MFCIRIVNDTYNAGYASWSMAFSLEVKKRATATPGGRAGAISARCPDRQPRLPGRSPNVVRARPRATPPTMFCARVRTSLQRFFALTLTTHFFARTRS